MPTDPEQPQGRLQERVVVEEPRGDRAGRRGGADRDRRDVARLVGRVGRAVLAEVEPGRLALVEGDEHGGRPALVGGAVQDLRQLVLQPQVAGLDGRRVRAVVHVVHRVGGDERERGQRVLVEVGLQLRVRDVEGAYFTSLSGCTGGGLCRTAWPTKPVI